jgi:hypothetical protein
MAWLHLSLGRPDRWFRWGVIEMAVACLCTLIGLSFGPMGVAAASSCSYLILIGPGLSYAGRPIGLHFSAILAATWMFFFSALIAGLLSWFPFHYFAPLAGFWLSMSALWRLILGSVLFLSFYLGTLWLFPFTATFSPLLDVWALLCPKWLSEKFHRKVAIAS